MDIPPQEEALRAAGGTREVRRPAPPPAPEADPIWGPGYEPKTAPGTPFPLTWFRDIEPITDSADFVQGLLIEKTAIVVYGESNSGKTFWTTDLALSVAAALTWNGRRVEQGGVIYCALEGGYGFRNRVAAWRREHGLEGENIPFAAISFQVNLLDPNADTGALIATIKAAAEKMVVPVKLVVIDTLSRALAGGNENAPDDMGSLVMNMDRVRAETTAALLLVHHSGKNQALGARGHSLLRAAIDTEVEVADADGEHTATVVKQRDLRKGDVFAFSLRVVELGVNRHGDPVTTCVVEPTDARPGGERRAHKPAGDAKRAMEVLTDLAASPTAQVGHAGVPAGTPSVPEEQWRDAFYSKAKPGATQEAKKRAFRRAADHLAGVHLVGIEAGRVWLA